jgi:hypothetical protein
VKRANGLYPDLYCVSVSKYGCDKSHVDYVEVVAASWRPGFLSGALLSSGELEYTNFDHFCNSLKLSTFDTSTNDICSAQTHHGDVRYASTETLKH